MANTTHHVKSDLKHRKNQPQQPKSRPGEQQAQTERSTRPTKTPARQTPADVEEGFDAPGSQRPPSDS